MELYKEHEDVKHYYDNGELAIEGQQKNGKATGVWSWYSRNGIKRMEGIVLKSMEYSCLGNWGSSAARENFNKRLNKYEDFGDWLKFKEGNCKYWDRQGILQKSIQYRDSYNTIYTYYHPNGSKQSRGEKASVSYLANGYYQYRMEPTGEWTYWHENGTVDKVCSYNHKLPNTLYNKYHGFYVEYYDNGQLACRVKYLFGHKKGEETLWNKDGSIDKKIKHGGYLKRLLNI